MTVPVLTLLGMFNATPSPQISGLMAMIPKEIISTVQVRRPVQGEGGGGLEERTYPTVTSIEAMQIEKLSEGLAARQFGQDDQEKWRAVSAPTSDVQQNDLLEVVAGNYVGAFLLVEDSRVPMGKLRIIKGADTEERP